MLAHGTSTLFAALEVATGGKVMIADKRCCRRIEFLDFMNEIAAAYPDTAIHVVLDNPNTYGPGNDQLLALVGHPNVHFHFTPTRVSAQSSRDLVLDPASNSLKDASFTSVATQEHIDAFIEAYNENAKARLTKSKVHQKCACTQAQADQ